MRPTRSIRPAKTAGVINTDVMGVLGPARDFSVRGNQKFGLLDMLVEEGARRGRRFTPDPQPETGGFFRSDHFTFAKAGIPALSLAGQGSGERRRRPRPGVARPTIRRRCTTSRPTNFARLGLHRHGPGRGVAARGRARLANSLRLAELERGQRIPRRPRPVARRARQGTARSAARPSAANAGEPVPAMF